MTTADAQFAGSIPDLYDRYLGALLFEPYAIELARRASALKPLDILETAAGTGIATSALHEMLPDAAITATDLNGPMLEAARRVGSKRVTFQQADAEALPFSDETFDLVLCQFGMMFYPDKVKANGEARRVLRPGGRYLAAIWDVIDHNPASKIAMDAVAKLFPDNPPSFFYRVPHGYADPSRIESDLLAAGFTKVELETVQRMSKPISAADAAIGICQGTPLRNELEARDGTGPEMATRAAAKALASIEHNGLLQSPLSAHIVTATR